MATLLSNLRSAWRREISRAHRSLRKLWHRLSTALRDAKNRIAFWPRPFPEEELRYYHALDEEDYRRFLLPPDEALGVGCVWAFEVYLASHLDSLVQGLRELDLGGPDADVSDPFAFIAEARRRGVAATTARLGLLCRDRPERGGAPADLPEGVESASITVSSPAPSVTILTVQFRFDEVTARGIEAPFGTRYGTVWSRWGWSRLRATGAQQRVMAVRSYRAALRQRCAAWLRARVPGAFAAHGGSASLPTVELLTFSAADPTTGRRTRVPHDDVLCTALPNGVRGQQLIGDESCGSIINLLRTAEDEGDRLAVDATSSEGLLRQIEKVDPSTPSASPYMSLLGFHGPRYVWTSTDLGGSVLSWLPAAPGEKEDAHLVLATRVGPQAASGPADAAVASSPEPAAATLAKVDHTLRIFALRRLLTFCDARLERMRGALTSLGEPADGRIKVLSTLKALGRDLRLLHTTERQLLTISRDTRPLLIDLTEQRTHQELIRDVYQFVAADPMIGGSDPLVETLSRALERDARRLLSAEAEVRATVEMEREFAIAMANSSVSVSNVWLQAAAVLLAVVAAVLAVLALPGLKRD